MQKLTFDSVRKEISEQLSPEYGTESVSLARNLLCDYYDISFTQLILNANQSIGVNDYESLCCYVERLKRYEPLQYIIGHTQFCGLRFEVNSSVLIPRPETQQIVDLVSERLIGTESVLDIGTGSGCIPIAIKKRKPNARVSAVDVSKEALAVAKRNSIQNGVEVNFVKCDILREMPQGEYEIVVSNPPYVCDEERSDMQKNVLDYEPSLALFVPNNNPLLFYREIARKCMSGLLKPNGYLFFEINERFGMETEEMLRGMDYKRVEVVKDYCNKDRFVVAMR
ncbi:MAG: peptide chain release factor N(5)-glutamine methyltransferase [Marinilabiliaceae bacterium]|nr:peptide chain release factor N(5)-glutamine methyltransferase [Marinilabiliaceae bacterium]